MLTEDDHCLSVDLAELPVERVRGMLELYQALVQSMFASNQILVEKLTGSPSFDGSHATILSDWSACNKGLFYAHMLAIERAVRGSH